MNCPVDKRFNVSISFDNFCYERLPSNDILATGNPQFFAHVPLQFRKDDARSKTLNGGTIIECFKHQLSG